MKKLLFYGFVFGLVMACCCACGGKSQAGRQQEQGSESRVDDSNPKYAKGFKVSTLDNGVRLVDVADPQKDEDQMPATYHFALLTADQQGADVPEGYTPITVPIDRTIVMTMLQLSNFTALDAHDVVKGITGTKNLFNADIRQRVKDGRIVKIGMEGNFDTELILAANPQVIFISPFKRGGYDAIKETGITLVPHLGYKELDPLGQAEWVKYVAMFIGKEQEAAEAFAAIEQHYNELKTLVAEAKLDTLPTVFSGEMHGGNWFAVGGRNYLAQIFRDAGARYVLNDDNTGGVPIEYEQMYAMAHDADYWRILNSYPDEFSYEALKASEPRNALYKAFKERHVIYCNMKQTPYYELSPVRPDLVLADFVAIFHPELVPADYEPTFYHLLK